MVCLSFFQWICSLLAITRRSPLDFKNDGVPYFDVFCAVISSAISIYIFLEFNNIGARAGSPVETDLLMGGFSILLVLEAARRSIGAPLPIVAILVLINCYLGPYFLDIPGLDIFAHRGYPISRIVDYMYLGTEGIFGIPLGVVATFVFHFVLFGLVHLPDGAWPALYRHRHGAGRLVGGRACQGRRHRQWIFRIHQRQFRSECRDGGILHHSLMKRVGYSPTFAAGVEAAAGTGGQLMPPVMGAAAFIWQSSWGSPM